MAVFDGVISAIVGAANAGGEFQIDRSLRFNSADSAYLNRTPSSAGNRKTWTWSGWVKRSTEGNVDHVFNATGYSLFYFFSDHKLDFDGGGTGAFSTARAFRDFSAWYHIVLAFDTTQATASNRIKLWVNGEQVQDWDSITYPAQNADGAINSTGVHKIGHWNTQYSNFYLADVHFIDGQALDPTDFGEFDDNNVWQAKEYTGTYGTNGFHLDFSDNSSNAALGTDSSGNNNDWTINNITAAAVNYSSGVSSPDGTISSSNPAANLFDGSLSTQVQTTTNGTTVRWTPPTTTSWSTSLRVNTGPYSGSVVIRSGGTNYTLNTNGSQVPSPYWLSHPNSSGTIEYIEAQGHIGAGVGYMRAIEIDGTILIEADPSDIDSLIDTPTNYEAASGNNGGNYATLNPLQKSSGSTLTNGNLDISMSSAQGTTFATMAFPASGKYYFECTANASQCDVGIAKAGASLSEYLGNNTSGYGYYIDGNVYHNNSSAGSGASYGSGDVIGVAFDADAGTCKWYKNNALQVTISSLSGEWFPAFGAGSAAGIFNFGSRPFAYTPPSNHVSLCTQNLPDPTIADGSTAFDTKLYTGNGTTQTISGLEYSPDLVWIKRRSGSAIHVLNDTVRDAGQQLSSNSSDAEITNTNNFAAFTSDGFTVGSGSGTNASSETHVAWTWDAGTSTVSNTDGSITSQVRANPSAGFSIVNWVRNGGSNTATIGHGLNAAPQLIILKNRDSSSDWYVGSPFIDTSRGDFLPYLSLNRSDGRLNNSDVFTQGGPVTNTTFGVGAVGNPNGNNLAYCFTSVESYSAIGSYTGNSSPTGGPFIYTGFKPKFLLARRTNASQDWVVVDGERSPDNVVNEGLYVNLSNAEQTSNRVDFLSNGFKLRTNNRELNEANSTYLYVAFAEHPFKTSRAR